MIPSVYLADLIQSLSLGTKGADLFIGDEPLTPDNVVTCIDSGPSEVDNNNNFHYEGSTVTILIRNRKYKDAYDKANEIKTGINKLTLQDYTYNNINYQIVSILHFGGPIPLGKDDKKRETISMTFIINYQQV
jgi:hypothetical protein